MEWLGGLVAVFVVVGVALSIFERRRGRPLVEDDRIGTAPQTETDRDAIRAEDAQRSHGATH